MGTRVVAASTFPGSEDAEDITDEPERCLVESGAISGWFDCIIP